MGAVGSPRLSVDELVVFVRRRSTIRSRYLLGLAGPPGVGKSTVADRLRDEVDAVVAPMDGFHRTNDELDRLGLRHRKGAPATFDADAFVERLSDVVRNDRAVPWPLFDRTVDEPVDGQLTIPPGDRVIVVEGNYLLLHDPPWDGVAGMCDDVAYLDLDAAVRVGRLVARHVAHGRSPDDAERFVRASDEINAELIERSRERCTIVVSMV